MKTAHLIGILAAVAAMSTHAAEAPDLTIEQTAEAFKQADPDSDGTVSRDEAKKFGIPSKVFTAANPDKDGTLDPKEFAAALTMMFRQANPDKDGTLDPKEAKKAGIKTKKTFEAANPDKDGTLDPVEFVRALMLQAK